MVIFNDLSDSQKTDKRARFDVLGAAIDAAATGDSEIAGKVEALETAVGDADSGLVKSVTTLESVVGDAETSDTVVYDVADIKAYIAEILAANNTLTDPRAGNG